MKHRITKRKLMRIIKEEYTRLLKEAWSSAAGQGTGQVNNPEEMSRMDAIQYLRGQMPDEMLMNDLYISDPEPGEEEEYGAGSHVMDVLHALGEEEDPFTDPPSDDDYDDDDSWNNDWERQSLSRYVRLAKDDYGYIEVKGESDMAQFYDWEDTDLVDFFVDENGMMEDNEIGKMIPADQWMDKYGYDLYYSAPNNIRRQDGQPFDEYDVKNITAFLQAHAKRLRQQSFMDMWLPHPEVGDTVVQVDSYGFA